MFKPIGNSLEKRQRVYVKKRAQEEVLTKTLQLFLRERFHIEPERNLLSYDFNEGKLIITSQSKALTNELIMVRASLMQFLRDEGIKVSEVILR